MDTPKFKLGDKVTLLLDKPNQVYVIREVRRAKYGFYTISKEGSYVFDDAWEQELCLIKDPNTILKEILK